MSAKELVSHFLILFSVCLVTSENEQHLHEVDTVYSPITQCNLDAILLQILFPRLVILLWISHDYNDAI